MPAREQPIVEIRPLESPDALPAGWATDSMRWNGQDVEVAYDRRLVRVARLRAGPESEIRHHLMSNGWRHVSTDSENAELWLVTTEDFAMARLDCLAVRAADAAPQTLSID